MGLIQRHAVGRTCNESSGSSFLRNIGRIDKMHFGFMAEKTTMDAIY